MSSYSDRLKALRGELSARKLDGFIVPLTDEHMSEYVGRYAQRLAWLTGFEGSAGTAVVLGGEAAIFVDGRYTLQVRQQVSADDWSYQSVPETSVHDWLKEHAPEGARIGYDPWLHRRDWVRQASEALKARGATLVPVADNPIDRIWADRPEASKAKLVVHPERFAGQSGADKRQKIADWLGEHKADAAVLAALDSIAWTFNVRGTDVSHTPVALAYALVRADGTATWQRVSGVPRTDARGRYQGYRGTGLDVTDRKRIEARLQQMNEELEQRVRARTSALEMANRELEAFSYSVSHDLRAPLRSIEGFAAILQETNAEHLDEDGKRCLERIRAATMRMSDLIEALIMLARIARFEVNSQPVDLSAIARECIEDFARKIAEPLFRRAGAGVSVNAYVDLYTARRTAGDSAKTARGTRSAISFHSVRQRRDSFIGVTNAPMTKASFASPAFSRV